MLHHFCMVTTKHPLAFHRCQQPGVGGGAGLGDGVVAFVDGVEDAGHVGDAQAVDADVADVRPVVQPNVRG
jgi:hypothetical protein